MADLQTVQTPLKLFLYQGLHCLLKHVCPNIKVQEGQLSVSGKRMCTILVNRLED